MEIDVLKEYVEKKEDKIRKLNDLIERENGVKGVERRDKEATF